MFSYLRHFDWKLNGAVALLSLASLVGLASISMDLFWKQLLFIVIGLVLMLFVTYFDWRSFANYRGVILGVYGVAIFLLILTLIIAPEIRGNKAWIPIGPFQFQASVFANLALIIVLASFFRKGHRSIAHLSTLAKSFIYFAIPAGLVYLQPDLGSVLLMFSVWFGFVLVSGIRWRHLVAAFMIFAVIGALGWAVFLKPYQKDRIVGVFFPDRDVLGVNYNVIQAKIAIGSAGLFGKGFGQGTQVQLGFLPEAHTDFIFSGITEEWGLITGFLLIGAFFWIIVRIVAIGLVERNSFSQFICLGIALFLLANFVFNTGSNIGLVPVIGVPYPFLSYGGSHILAEFILLGMIQSIKLRNA
ncbi:MAG: Rod shape-determining protein RodA [Candidatus Wolfebacteria bacterium GW2011_GWE1_48_7]|uniref:Rod shape-determining protein RodA n=2 Tax=Candidatus Wolfeibacteriota TaxID=1752735 RepID=A0A0G1X4X2_9BACT|nr:MAG: rod shape-determining protein RodA, rod shape determining protein RodA [Candidatus Wolfebacteria bacterium GW2011_GWB1_47_1]KKU37002.1 MAG: Rod shape-determining protein RodA [Candidatus Wolfebacteria bacterium GW2011_GWC2_46_275]KKU42504.1 MAG: Rod shape-determining protein RodA [Candidatus Wolfebacteria bacterium GW2011_GWB2_46_69]KKU53881.1 MAG: Rod shape-determining protein RodA [Candidatus Wolfebacteria bacterium GW2011_GWC1_47_103]KKU59657.1 MAG: Rod shape-determining protein RodA